MRYIFTIGIIFFALQNQAVSEEPFYNLNSPRNTFKTFLRNMKAYKDGRTEYLQKALGTLNLNHLPTETKSIVGENKARLLIDTLDRLEFIKYESIPNENFNDDTWTYKTRSIFWRGENINAVIEISKVIINDKPQWLFSRDTIDTIDAFYSSVKNKKVVKGVTQLNDLQSKIKSMAPAWTGHFFLFLKIGQWIGIFTLVLLSLVLSKIFRLYFSSKIEQIFKSRNIITNNEGVSFLGPFGISLFFLTLFVGLRFLELSPGILSYVLRLNQIALTVALVVTTVRLVDVIATYFEGLASKTESKFDDVLIPLLRTGAKLFVWAIGLVFIGHSLTVDVKNIIAGLGIGGLAFALAAKDTLSNLFGSLTVILDRPFEIGDWVKLGNGVEGNIESVGFRSTRIRTFYDSLVTVPNNQLTNIHIDNMGKRTFRRFSTTLGVQYDTPVEKIEAFCEGIRQIIVKQPHTRKDYFNVYLTDMGASSLNIILHLFWKVSDYSEELTQKHRLLVDIIRLAKTLGVEFAFPTQTLHVFNEDKYEISNINEDVFAFGQRQGEEISEKPISPLKPRSKSIEGKLPPVNE